MNSRLRCLIVFLFLVVLIILPAHVLAGPSNLPPLQEEIATESLPPVPG
jgi:hypothetical protein